MTALVFTPKSAPTALALIGWLLRKASAFWVSMALIGTLDLVWMHHDAVRIDASQIRSFVMVPYFLAMAWLARQGRQNFVKSSITRACVALSQLAAVAIVLAPFSYLMTSLSLPLNDQLLRRLDAFFGFDWAALQSFIANHAMLAKLLWFAYPSIGWQPAIIITICSMYPTSREIEFTYNYALSLIMCITIGGIFPAFGEPSAFWPGLAAEITAIRGGHWSILDYGSMQGVIAFPSFHAAFAIIAIYSVRHSRIALLSFGVLNALMILSTPTIGHYLTDVIGGIAVAGASIWIVGRLAPATRQRPAPGGFRAPRPAGSPAGAFAAPDPFVRPFGRERL